MSNVLLPSSSESGPPHDPARAQAPAEVPPPAVLPQAQSVSAPATQPARSAPLTQIAPIVGGDSFAAAPEQPVWPPSPQSYPPPGVASPGVASPGASQYEWQQSGQAAYPWTQAAPMAQPQWALAAPPQQPYPQIQQPYPQPYPQQPGQVAAPPFAQQPGQVMYPQQSYPQAPSLVPSPAYPPYQTPPPDGSLPQVVQQTPAQTSAPNQHMSARTTGVTSRPALAYEIARDTPQSPMWRAIKWPIRNLLKVIYLVGSSARRHRAVAAVVLLVVLLGATGYGVYAYTHGLGSPVGGSDGLAAQDNTTPFTIVTASQPPLAPGVVMWLHAYKSFDGHELWNSLSPGFQKQLSAKGVSSEKMHAALQQEKGSGLAYDEFIYSGGYIAPDGTSHFTIEAFTSQGTAKALYTWYFVTDPSGKILLFQNLTPRAS